MVFYYIWNNGRSFINIYKKNEDDFTIDETFLKYILNKKGYKLKSNEVLKLNFKMECNDDIYDKIEKNQFIQNIFNKFTKHHLFELMQLNANVKESKNNIEFDNLFNEMTHVDSNKRISLNDIKKLLDKINLF